MLERHSLHKVPNQLVKLCSLGIKTKRRSYLEICQVIEQDEFLNLYLKTCFKEHWLKGGVMTLIKSLGWEGLRDRVSEAFLHQSCHRRFPTELNINYAQDNIDFERRFEFLSASGNQRVFLLGHFLTQNNLALEEQGISLLVPLEVDAVLSKYKSKSLQPDWLIVATWGLVVLLGEEPAEELLKNSGGDWEEIEKSLSPNDLDKFLGHLLTYGFAIEDQSFFITETV